MSARIRTFDARALIAPAALALGCVATAIKPVAYSSTFTSLLIGGAGALASVRHSQRARPLRWVTAFAVGAGAFAMSRLFASPHGVRMTAFSIFTLMIAAVCEELFFRRFCYGWVEERVGVAAAIVVSAITFAIVHVPLYGWGVLPMDIAAGLILGWQRWVSGGWTAPAATHMIANLLQMG